MFIRRRHFAQVLASVCLLFSLVGCRGVMGTTPSSISSGTDLKISQRFGMHMHDAIHHWPSVTFGYWRVWDAGVSWAQVEQAPGQYDWSLMDQYVDLATQHNVKMIYVLGNTPTWASTDPNHVGTQGLAGATAPPSNMQYWRDYVQAVLTRYKGRIYAYEIWNEVDLSGYWTGSTSQMIQIAQTAYQVVKQTDPQALVLSPSLVAGNGRSYLKNYFGAGGDKYSDAVAYHLYDTQRDPEDSLTDVYLPDLAVAQQWGKPIWDTEMGWGPFGSWETEQAAAAYTARSLILQAASGIPVIVWFAWDDRGPWVHIDFLEADYVTPTAAAIAYQQIQSWLYGASISCTNDSTGTWQCPVSGNAGKTTYIVWNRNASQTFSIPSSWQIKAVTDLSGAVQSISGSSMTITTSPVLLSP